LLPELARHKTTNLAITKLIMSHIYVTLYNKDAHQFRKDFVRIIMVIARENTYQETVSIKRLKKMRKQVKGLTNLKKSEAGEKIISLLIDFYGQKSSKFAQKGMLTNRNNRLLLAIEEFKEHSLDLNA